MDTRVLVSVILNNERGKLGLEWQYARAICSFIDSYHVDSVDRISLIDKLRTLSSDYFVYVKYANVMNLSTLEIEVMSIEDCIRYNVIGLHLDPSDLLDDGSMPINVFGYSKRLCRNVDADSCAPFIYDGKLIKIGDRFSKSLIYYYITYGELELQLHINIENNTFKLGDFIQTDGFKDRDDNEDKQWYGMGISVDNLCGIYLYNPSCAYGYEICIIDELVDDIIVPNGVKEVRILLAALSKSKTIVLPISIDNIIIEYSSIQNKHLKTHNWGREATIIVSNSIKDKTLIEITRDIIGGINDRDSAIEFIRKTICKLEFY